MGFRSTNHTFVFLSPSFLLSEPRNLTKWVILNLILNFVEEISLSLSLSNYSSNMIIGWHNFYIRVPTITCIFTVYLSQNYTGNDFHISITLTVRSCLTRQCILLYMYFYYRITYCLNQCTREILVKKIILPSKHNVQKFDTHLYFIRLARLCKNMD